MISGLTGGCATNCAGWKPIKPSRADVLTRGTKEQIVGHNEFGERQGCSSFGGKSLLSTFGL